jgi:predicted transcriptional regulator
LTLRIFGCTIVAMGKIRQNKKLVLPTPAEFGLLQILWHVGEGTVDDIVEASGQNPRPNYKTVQTLLRIMERKGQVGHSHQGRAFLFRPLVGQDEVRRLSVRHLLGRYFTGSRTQLFMEVLSDEPITREELRQLEDLIRSRRKA